MNTALNLSQKTNFLQYHFGRIKTVCGNEKLKTNIELLELDGNDVRNK